jgi:hypothetical protein
MVEFLGPYGRTPDGDPVLYGLVATVVAGQLGLPGQTGAEVVTAVEVKVTVE